MNKISFLISLFLLGFQMLTAQEVAIGNPRANYALPLINNRITIVVEGEFCKNIIVATNNGTIEKLGDESCEFEFRPEKIGYALLSIYKLSNDDRILVEERKFRVKPWPDLKPFFGRISSTGKMPLAVFHSYDAGVYVPTLNMDIDAKFKVSSYEIIVMRSDEVVYKLKNTGGKIELKNNEILKKLRKGDIVLFQKIMARFPAEPVDRELSDLRIEIIN